MSGSEGSESDDSSMRELMAWAAEQRRLAESGKAAQGATQATLVTPQAIDIVIDEEEPQELRDKRSKLTALVAKYKQARRAGPQRADHLVTRASVLTDAILENGDVDANRLVAAVLQSFFTPAVSILAWNKAAACANGDEDRLNYLTNLEKRIAATLDDDTSRRLLQVEPLSATEALDFEPLLLRNTARIVFAISDYPQLAEEQREAYLDSIFQGEDDEKRWTRIVEKKDESDRSKTYAHCKFLNETACRSVGKPCQWANTAGKQTGYCRVHPDERAASMKDDDSDEEEKNAYIIERPASVEAQDLLNDFVRETQGTVACIANSIAEQADDIATGKTTEQIRSNVLSNVASLCRMGGRLMKDTALPVAAGGLVGHCLTEAAGMILNLYWPSTGRLLVRQASPIFTSAVAYGALRLANSARQTASSSTNVPAEAAKPFRVRLETKETRALHKRLKELELQSQSNPPKQPSGERFATIGSTKRAATDDGPHKRATRE